MTGAKVTYTLPSGLTGTWSAVYSGGATGSGTSGTGNINQTVNLISGAAVTYTVVVPIPGNRTGMVTTTAAIAPAISANDPITDNNTATGQ